MQHLILYILKWYSTTKVMLIDSMPCYHRDPPLCIKIVVLQVGVDGYVFESIKNLLYWIKIELPCRKIADSTKINEIRLTTLKNPTTEVFWGQSIKLIRIVSTSEFHEYCRDIHIHRVFQTIQMKLILWCVWAERAVSGSAKTALKFKYEI